MFARFTSSDFVFSTNPRCRSGAMEIEVEVNGVVGVDDAMQIPWSRNESMNVGKRTLIIKIIVVKSFTEGIFRNTLIRGWNMKGEVKMSDIGCNQFIFSFDIADGCSRVLRDRSWSVAGYLILLP